MSVNASAIATWNALLRPDVELSEPFWSDLAGRMRSAQLTFGGERLNCPFLRPCFIERAEGERVARIGAAMWRMGERVAELALERRDLLDRLRLDQREEALVRIDPGYRTASTASRLDAFLLPDSLKFAEYNAESPAGLGYSEVLGEIFGSLEIARRFSTSYDSEQAPLMARLLDALVASYREWGGTASPPQVLITDWREVPTWNEFEIIARRFEQLGVPTVVCDPRDLEFDGRTLTAAGRPIDLVYRRVLMTDIVSRPDECRPLVDAYRARAVCVANTFRCKLPHKKTFFAVLTDPRFADLFSAEEHQVIRAHVPWTRLVEEGATDWHGQAVDLLEHVRARRDSLVLKPADEYGGSGVTLGWELDEAAWSRAIAEALAHPERGWIVQERIPIRRERFPIVRTPHRVEQADMLVDFAPYLFRGKLAGYLTRLSSTGLANVTSGGGQVPVFVIEPTTP